MPSQCAEKLGFVSAHSFTACGQKSRLCASPWKSGPLGPRNPRRIRARFSPCGRFPLADCILPQPVQPCRKCCLI